MGDDFRRVTRGEDVSIPARTWNALMDLVDGDGLRDRDDARAGARDARVPPRQATHVRVKNNYTTTVGRFGILGIVGVAIADSTNLNEFQSRPVLIGDLPTYGESGKFVVLQEPIAAGAIGWAVVSGLTPCYVNISDTTHKFADILNADGTKLGSTLDNPGGAQILWKHGGMGDQWAIIRLSNKSDFGITADFKWITLDYTTSPGLIMVRHTATSSTGTSQLDFTGDSANRVEDEEEDNFWSVWDDGLDGASLIFNVITDIAAIPYTTYDCFAFAFLKRKVQVDERGHVQKLYTANETIIKLQK